MKNIHVLPTPNPSRLLKQNNNKLILSKQIVYSHISKHLENINQNIYITNDEKPKAGEWSLYQNKIHKCIEDIVGDEFKKIILTTDPQLIQDGVQPINDEFLEWFVNNPSCEEIEVENIPNNSWGFDLEEPMNLGYKIIIPSEEPKQETFNSKRGLKEVQLKDPNTCENYKEVGCVKDVCDCYTLVAKQETLEEAQNQQFKYDNLHDAKEIASKIKVVETLEEYQEALKQFPESDQYSERIGFEGGAKWQQEQDKNKYSEEDLKEILTKLSLVNPSHLKMTIDGYGEFPDSYKLTEKGVNYIIEQIKKK